MPKTSKYRTPEELAQAKREANARWRAKHPKRWIEMQRAAYQRRKRRRQLAKEPLVS